MAQHQNSPLVFVPFNREAAGIIIRKGIFEDYEQVLALMEAFALFQKTPEKLHITWEQMVADKDLFQCFIAEDEGKIVAFASFFFAYYSWSGKAIYLDDLYVKDECRKSNIGTGLLNAVIQFAKEQHCKTVRWLVSRWNENAIDFYKKMGAEIEGTEMPCVYHLA